MNCTMRAVTRIGFFVTRQTRLTSCSLQYSGASQWVITRRSFSAAITETSKSIETDKRRELRDESPADKLFEFPHFESSLTLENQEKVLEVVNTASLAELADYSLSKTRAKNLVSFRTKHGQLQSLSDMMHIDGFGVPVVEKLCKHIVDDDKKSKRPAGPILADPVKAGAAIINPELGEEQRQRASTLVGVEMTPLNVSWAKINLNTNQVVEWGCRPLFTDEKRVKESVILEMAHSIHRALPKSDLYAFEEKNFRSGQQKFSPISAQMKQLQVMLFALLNVPFDDANPVHKVFLIKPSALTQLFQIKVGSERVSTQPVTEDIIRRYRKQQLYRTVLDPEPEKQDDPLPITSLLFDSPELPQIFSSANTYDREHLSNALLITAAFADVGIRRRVETLQLLTRRSKNVPKKKST